MALLTFLVEDNRTIRDHLIPALEDLIAARIVGIADTEPGAIEWLANHPDDWQLLVLDLFLLSGSGLGVLRACQTRRPSQHAVILSNYVNSDIRERCLALGANAVFDKSKELDLFFDYCNQID